MRRSIPAAVIAAMMATTGVASVSVLSLRLGSGSGDPATATTASVDSAKTCFDRARKLGFPAAGQATPYLLHAEFTTRASSGVVTTGTYTDTWVSEKQWRREAVIGESRFVRSRNGKKWYRLDDGPDAPLLQFVLTALEPLPEMDGKSQGNWKVDRDPAAGAAVTRVWRGKQNGDGTPDPKDFEAYWFDESGQLVRSYLNGLEIKRENFEDFNGVHVARQLQVNLTGKTGMKIKIKDVQPLGAVDAKIFTVKGNDWRRGYTTEVR
jgi:hypothetical protein